MFFNKGAAGKKLDYFLSFFQYYIHAKNPLPMDIEFLVQDIFALCRPQWKLASNIEEATKVFQLAMVQDQKTSGLDKAVEQDDETSGGSSDDEPVGDQDDDDESGSEDGEVEVEASTTLSIKLWQRPLTGFESHRTLTRMHPTMRATLRRRPFLLPGRKNRLTLKMKLILTASMRKSWPKAPRRASSSRSNKSTFPFPSGPRLERPRVAVRPPKAAPARRAEQWPSRY